MDLVTDVNVQRLDTALPLAGTMIYKNVQLSPVVLFKIKRRIKKLFVFIYPQRAQTDIPTSKQHVSQVTLHACVVASAYVSYECSEFAIT